MSRSNCSHVFKDGKATPNRDDYTNLWIKLINRIERDK